MVDFSKATWEKYWHKYQTKAKYYAKRIKSDTPDVFRDIDQFKAQVSGYSQMRGTSIEQTITFLAQKAGLYGASVKQIQALQREHMEKTGATLSFRSAAYIFSPRNKETEDIMKMAQSLGIDTEEDLRQAVLNGELTLSEANIILVRKFGVIEERSHWISQNIFGSN